MPFHKIPFGGGGGIRTHVQNNFYFTSYNNTDIIYLSDFGVNQPNTRVFCARVWSQRFDALLQNVRTLLV